MRDSVSLSSLWTYGADVIYDYPYFLYVEDMCRNLFTDEYSNGFSSPEYTSMYVMAGNENFIETKVAVLWP